MNNVVLIGRLTKDPELSYTPNTQTAVARFTLAVDRPRNNNGEQPGADFIRISVFGKQAENCDKYLSKGRQAAVLGRIQTGSYKNNSGDTVYTTDVVADRVEFIGSKNDNNGGGNVGQPIGNPQDLPWEQGGNEPAPANTGASQQVPQQVQAQNVGSGFQSVDDDLDW